MSYLLNKINNNFLLFLGKVKNILNKKITLLISSLAGGGSESVCITLANSFVDNGWQVDLIVLNINNEVYLNHLSKKINLVVLNKKHARFSFLALLKYIFKKKPYIFLVFNYELTVILVVLKIIFNLKIKIISRNSNTLSIKLKNFKYQNFWSKYVVLNLIKFFYQKTDHVVNQCKGMQKDLIKLYSNLEKKSSVITNPLSLNIENYCKIYDLRKIDKQNYILCVGRLEEQKAFHFAIDAFASIKNKFPGLRLKIVGKGSLEKELKQRVKDLNIENFVDFENFQKNIIPYYLYAKGTILTSIYEGYPNVLIESIALNTPVVSFNCPNGPSEIVKNGVNGYLVDYMDIHDLKKKISDLLRKKFEYYDLQKTLQSNQVSNVYLQYKQIINCLS